MERLILAVNKAVTRILLAITAGSFLLGYIERQNTAIALAVGSIAFVLAITCFWIELYLERKSLKRSPLRS